MQGADLLSFGTGGGGLFGQDQDCTLDNFRFAEHSFQKLASDRATIEKVFPPGCMLGVDIYPDEVEEGQPDHQTQWYNVGNLPFSRLQELSAAGNPVALEGADPKRPGGYRPSIDNENPAEEGAFVVLEGKTDIWNGAPYALLMEEFKNLGLGEHQDRLAAEGVAALNKIRVHLGTKAMPKSKRQLQDEQASGQSKLARSILVPTEIHAWPWEAQKSEPPAAKPKAAPAPAAAKPAAQKPAQKPAAAPAAQAPAAAGLDEDKVAGYVKQALKNSGGTLEKKLLGSKLMSLMAKEGAARVLMMQRANNADFLGRRTSDWAFDPSTEQIVLLEG